VDDRTDLTIGYRLKDCQKMGIPIVIAFGKRAVSVVHASPPLRARFSSFQTEQNLCEVIDVYNNQTTYLTYDDTLRFIDDYYSVFC
jgi:hypothetical protein